MSPRELKQALEAGRPLVVLDVREPFELDIARLPFALPMPMRLVPDRLAELDAGVEVVVLCHHGVRSAAVARFLHVQGFTRVHNLEGGIDGWSLDVDSTVPRY